LQASAASRQTSGIRQTAPAEALAWDTGARLSVGAHAIVVVVAPGVAAAPVPAAPCRQGEPSTEPSLSQSQPQVANGAPGLDPR